MFLNPEKWEMQYWSLWWRTLHQWSDLWIWSISNTAQFALYLDPQGSPACVPVPWRSHMACHWQKTDPKNCPNSIWHSWTIQKQQDCSIDKIHWYYPHFLQILSRDWDHPQSFGYVFEPIWERGPGQEAQRCLKIPWCSSKGIRDLRDDSGYWLELRRDPEDIEDRRQCRTQWRKLLRGWKQSLASIFLASDWERKLRGWDSPLIPQWTVAEVGLWCLQWLCLVSGHLFVNIVSGTKHRTIGPHQIH